MSFDPTLEILEPTVNLQTQRLNYNESTTRQEMQRIKENEEDDMTNEDIFVVDDYGIFKF